MNWLKKNIWWTSFLGVFGFGLLIILIYCKFKYSEFKSISLTDWLSYFSACGTIGGFLYLILDKVLSEREANHLKWQSEIPFVTIASPCDPTSNYCEIDILNFDTGFSERGTGYFSICNLGKTNAYDIKILFYKDSNYIDSNIFNRHYIPYLPPLLPIGYYTGFHYEFREFIYSNYNVNPDTKEISNSKFEICGCLENCNVSSAGTNEKYFFIKLEYYSSFSKQHRYKITSTFKVIVICIADDLINNVNKQVKIKGITLLDYDYKES